MPEQAEHALPELVRLRDLIRYGLTRADAERVLRLSRPIIHVPGGRAVYVRRAAVEAVLAEFESWVR